MGSNVVVCLWAGSGYDRSAQGVMGAGRSLADALGGALHAVVVGPAEETVVHVVAEVSDTVVVAGQPELAEYQPELYLEALQQMVAPLDPAAVLLGSDTAAVELTARLAARLGGSPMSDAVHLTAVNGAVRVTRSAYGGKAEAVLELCRRPAVVWVRPRAFDPPSVSEGAASVEKVEVQLPSSPATRVVARHVEQQEGVPLEDAQVVVGGGRGIGGAEAFEELRRLAEVMHAALGGSRSACDEGWVAPSMQIGQTGKKIAPELYLAVAVSGAAQHMLGAADAKTICAVNTDPDAPIFRHCTFGIVEDYRKVLPLLIERLPELAG